MQNNLPKITYLFGAGASAQTMPTIKELPNRIKTVREYIEKNYNYSTDEILNVGNLTLNRNEAKNYLLEGLDKLHSYSHNHSTIDTYAKKLHIATNESKVNELCFFLALYFNIEQKIAKVDSRYDTFFVSVLDSDTYNFPVNLKFLTWNYDLQMELAHNNISGANRFDFSYDLFNTKPDKYTKNKFTSVKINGSCTIRGRFDRGFPVVANLGVSEIVREDLDYALSYGYYDVKLENRIHGTSTNIDFAWYKDSDLLAKISDTYSETKILVVIGYSFPFFNRNVDRQIIRAMVNLKKIYIQDMHPENIKSRFLSILPDWQENDIEIIAVNDITEFFLPPEL
jgi:hypothetical protein